MSEIINPVIDDQAPTAPKLGNKWGLTHLDGGSSPSDSSGEDLDAKGAHIKKKVAMPTKVSHPSQWSEEDIDVMCQIRYKTDLTISKPIVITRLIQQTLPPSTQRTTVPTLRW